MAEEETVLLRHHPDGEVYVATYRGDRPVAAAGPLARGEYRAALAGDYDPDEAALADLVARPGGFTLAEQLLVALDGSAG